jgi:hypothetical protein
MFTLSQWLQLVAMIAIPCVTAWLVTKGTLVTIDRQEARRRRELEKVFEEIGKMPD